MVVLIMATPFKHIFENSRNSPIQKLLMPIDRKALKRGCISNIGPYLGLPTKKCGKIYVLAGNQKLELIGTHFQIIFYFISNQLA